MTASALALWVVALPTEAHATEEGAAALNALAKARLAQEAGRPDAALSALVALSGHAPDLPGLRGRILEQAIQAGDFPTARAAAAQSWADGDRRFDAQLVLIVDAFRRSDWKNARSLMDERSGRPGIDPITGLQQLLRPTIDGWVDVGAGANQPERHLLAAGRGGRIEPSLLMQAALIQQAVRRPSDAVALADDTRPTDRVSQWLALSLAASLDKVGERDAAERLRQRMVLTIGEREDPLLLLPVQPVATPREGTAQWLALLSDSFVRTPSGSPKLSLLLARAASWLDDRNWLVRSVLVESLDRNGHADKAIAALSVSREKTPPVLEMRRAELVADAGDLSRAAALGKAAVVASPQTRNLLVRYADLARRADDATAAGAAYAQLEAILGDSPEDQALRGIVLITRAELLLQNDDWNAAETLLEQAVALRPNDATILNFAGYSALERRKNVAESLARIEIASKNEPQNPSITDSLGWAYLLTGRVDDAVPLLERAQRGEPTNAVIVEHLGDAYWKAGRRFQARYTWRAAELVAEKEMSVRLQAKLRHGLTPATLAP